MHAQRGFPQPVAHLPYFIERADADWQTPAPRPHDRPYFLFVGRLEKIKGVHTLIDAWRKVTSYDLVVVGTGSQEAALRAAADQAGLLADEAQPHSACDDNQPPSEPGHYAVPRMAISVANVL